jgi:uncharacterized protein involved in cysteine biosynthesis
MTVTIEAGRLVFTLLCFAGLLARSAYFVAALADREYLRRVGASPTLREMLGPWFEIELAMWIIITPVAIVGVMSFFTPVSPRTIFGLIATAVFIVLILAIEFIDYRLFRRRRHLLGNPESRYQEEAVQKLNGNHV